MSIPAAIPSFVSITELLLQVAPTDMFLLLTELLLQVAPTYMLTRLLTEVLLGFCYVKV